MQQEEQGMLDMMANLQQLKAELEQQGRNYMSDKVVRGHIVMADLPNMGTSVQGVIGMNNKLLKGLINAILIELLAFSVLVGVGYLLSFL